jgi:hypothetical protein
MAFSSPPLSGPYCKGSCFNYPYTDIISRFPRDYYWLFPAIALSLIFYILMVFLHYSAPDDKKIFSHIGQSFALASSLILIIDYFLQLTFIHSSLLSGEVEGIALLSQFNPHGIFIILEELGFMFMSLSFLFMAPVFKSVYKIERILKIFFLGNFILTVGSFFIFIIVYGVLREYRFEITVISINWMTLLFSSCLLSLYFKRKSR